MGKVVLSKELAQELQMEKEPTTLPVTIIGNITDNPELMEGK